MPQLIYIHSAKQKMCDLHLFCVQVADMHGKQRMMSFQRLLLQFHVVYLKAPCITEVLDQVSAAQALALRVTAAQLKHQQNVATK